MLAKLNNESKLVSNKATNSSRISYAMATLYQWPLTTQSSLITPPFSKVGCLKLLLITKVVRHPHGKILLMVRTHPKWQGEH